MNAALTAVVNGFAMSLVMTAVLWLITKRFSKRSWNAATRYIVWWAALLATILMPLLYVAAHPAPVSREQNRGASAGAGMHNEEPFRERGNRAIQLPGEGAFPSDLAVVPSSLQSSRTEPAAPSVSQPLFPIQIDAGPWARWVFLIWISASGFMLLRLSISYVVLERRKAAAEAHPAHQARLDEWLARCGAQNRRIRLAFSSEIPTPIAAGPYRPSILIPHRMPGLLSEEELNQVGLHEAAHFRRHDDLTLILQRIIEAVFIFHPVVHWITRCINLEREIACDDFVVQLTGNARPYAVCLTRVVELTNGAGLSEPAASVTEPRSQLETRVEMLLDRSRKTTTGLLKARLTGALASMCLIVWIAAAMPSPVLFATPAKPARPAAAAPSEASTAKPVERFRTPSKTSQAPGPGKPAPGTATDSALVEIPAVITDPLGRFVSGLDKENFKVFEDEVEQSVARVSTNEPISVAFVYDIRNGQSGAELLQQAVSEFRKTAGSGDEFRILYGSNGQVETSSGLQNSDEVINRVKSTQAEPFPLGDGIRTAFNIPRTSRNAQRIIVILSDGDEHYTPVVPPSLATSDHPEAYIAGARAGRSEAMLNMASSGDAIIYAISLTSLYPAPGSTLGAPAGPALLDEITEATGGRHFPVANALETQPAITRMDVEIRNSYLVQYRRETAAQGGRNGQIRVDITPPAGIRALYAHVRPGYSDPSPFGTFSTIDQAALRSSQALAPNLSSSDPVIISDTEGIDFTGYLKQITDGVRSSWFSRIPDSAKQGQKGGVQVTFSVLHDGSIQAAHVSKGSGIVALDQASLESVKASAPFAALPQRFKQDRIVVRLSFFYNLK